MITRFAPSPTGRLHLGHVRAAYEAFNFGAECILRIEDIDHTRCQTKFTTAIYEDLTWLGFKWPQPVRIQSQHKQDYKAVMARLLDLGVLYPCYRSRAELATSAGPAPLTSARKAHFVSQGRKPAYRLNIDLCRDRLDALSFTEIGPLQPGTHKIDWERLNDEVIVRRDIGLSYHLCVSHDDAYQNITHIVRGTDLFDTTPYHRILQALLGWPEPLYYHHDVLRRQDGKKLSKRNGDMTVKYLRDNGLGAAQILTRALE